MSIKKTPKPAPVAPVATPPAEPTMVSIRDLSLEQLRAMRSNVNAEIKRRDEEAAAARPKKGERVKVLAKGRFNGKVGTVLFSKKTRSYVEVEGIEQPAYCLFAELVRPDAEGADK